MNSASSTASEGEYDHAVHIRNLLANFQGSNSGENTDCMAQLLAAAVAQFGNGNSAVPSTSSRSSLEDASSVDSVSMDGVKTENLNFNPNSTEDVRPSSMNMAENTVEVPTGAGVKRKSLCVKFPVELRKRIIAMRKKGKKCVEVAKELQVSVSGAQKVWERFLATGTVHDRKPSTYAGRPKKYHQTQDTPLLDSGRVKESVEDCKANEYHESPDVLVEEALDVPGATVVVETECQLMPTLAPIKQRQIGSPAYRHRLLLKLVKDCPLASLRDDTSLAADNPHVVNLSSAMNRPLYMEYVLGHPFGKVPSSQPFDGSQEEAQIILTDPAAPIGKDLLAALGYSTKVHFNACCKPGPLFNKKKIMSDLPFSMGPGHLAETMQAVLQLLLNLCSDPVAALERIPEGTGLTLTVGKVVSKKIASPEKLSDYWQQLYNYASLLECCENFLSATKPSAPCLLCHPFEPVVQTLEIQDDTNAVYNGPSEEEDEKADQQVEVQVLQSGQIEFSTQNASSNISFGGSIEMTGGVHNASLPCVDSEAPPAQPLEQTQVQSAELESLLIEMSTQTDQPPHLKGPPPLLHTRQCSDGTQSMVGIQDEQTRPPTCATQEFTTSSRHCVVSQNELHAPSSSRETDLESRQQQFTSNRKVSRKVGNTETATTGPKKNPYNLRHKHSPNNASASEAQVLTLEGEYGETNPLQWSVDEVVQFINAVPHCSCAGIFREHEVDGESLMTLDPEMMVKLLNIKAGPALRIHKRILQLKKQYT